MQEGCWVLKIRLSGLFSAILVCSLVLSLTEIFSLPASAAEKRFQIAYDFEGSDLYADFNGVKDILSSSVLYGTEGRNGSVGVTARINLNKSIFASRSAGTLSFWFKPEFSEESAPQTVFFAGNESAGAAAFSVIYISSEKRLEAKLSSGDKETVVSVSLESYFNGSGYDWLHVVLSVGEKSSGEDKPENEGANPGKEGYPLTVYLNGKQAGREIGDVPFYDLTPQTAYLGQFNFDDIYITNIELSPDKVILLNSGELISFVAMETSDWNDPSDAKDPFPAEENPVENNDPVPGVTDFTWAGYTFDSGFNVGADLNGKYPAAVNSAKMAVVRSENYDGNTQKAIARREGVVPSSYMTLNRGLLLNSESFSIALRVYRAAPSGYVTGTLFEFSGTGGELVFSPFSQSTSGGADAFFAYGNNPDSLTKENIEDSYTDISNKWTHYCLTYDKSGFVKIYVNGEEKSSFSTGQKLSSLKLSDLKLITNLSSADRGRILIDDVYITTNVLEASDVRKIEYYGVERFTGEVLADPNPEGENSGGVQVDLRPDSTDNLEDAYYETASINGYLGTSFDDSTLIGRDVNNAVSAVIRNASLSEGYVKYGLNLNGVTSYLRYPAGIMDGLEEMTVSLMYKWNGPSSTVGKQKLFDFSSKTSSVATPSAYFYMDMGDGSGGMTFYISDGQNKTIVDTGVKTIGEWQRVTVTLKAGVVRIYINGEEKAKSSTNVNLSAIHPNFCYVGKSGTKGDPLFYGIVDEIYISRQAISKEQIQRLSDEGLSAAVAFGSNQENGFSWDKLLNGLIIAGVCILIILIGAVIAIIAVNFYRRRKENPSLPKKKQSVSNLTSGRSRRRNALSEKEDDSKKR